MRRSHSCTAPAAAMRRHYNAATALERHRLNDPVLPGAQDIEGSPGPLPGEEREISRGHVGKLLRGHSADSL